MARMVRWTLLTGVLAAGALVGPLGSEARAQVGYGGGWGWGRGFYPNGAWGNFFFPNSGYYGGYYTGLYGGYYPYFDGVLPYPYYSFALYPMWSYVPSSANAPYPKVIEIRRGEPARSTDAAPGSSPASEPVHSARRTVVYEDAPAVTSRRTVVYRANLNSATPAGQIIDQQPRQVVLRPRSR